jgi:hypothetical protein
MIYSGSGSYWSCRPDPEATLGKKTLKWNVFCALSEQVVGIYGSVKIRETRIFGKFRSVSDPDSLNPDPDPAFEAEYGSESGCNPYQGFC